MTGNEARKLTSEELTAEIARLRAASFALRTQKITDKIDDHAKFRTTRRDIARLLTEQSARARAAAAKSGGSKGGKGAAKPTSKGGNPANLGRGSTRAGRKAIRWGVEAKPVTRPVAKSRKK